MTKIADMYKKFIALHGNEDYTFDDFIVFVYTDMCDTAARDNVDISYAMPLIGLLLTKRNYEAVSKGSAKPVSNEDELFLIQGIADYEFPVEVSNESSRIRS